MVEYDYKTIGLKLKELDDIRASLQGKTKTSQWRVISIIITIFFGIVIIAYFTFLDWQMDELNFEIFLGFVFCLYLSYYFSQFEEKVKKIDIKIDTIIKLLELEKLVDKVYVDKIKEIANTPQTS